MQVGDTIIIKENIVEEWSKIYKPSDIQKQLLKNMIGIEKVVTGITSDAGLPVVPHVGTVWQIPLNAFEVL